MTKHIYLYSFIALLFFTLHSCNDISEILDIYTESTSVDENINFEDDFEWLTTTNGFGLMLPKYLYPINELKEPFSFYYANINKTIIAIGIKQQKKEVIKFLKSTEYYQDTLSLIKNYSQYSLNNYTDHIGVDKIVKNKSTQLRGMSLEILEIVSSKKKEIKEMKLGSTLAILEGKEHLYALIYICKGVEYEKYRISFEKSISTFRKL